MDSQNAISKKQLLIQFFIGLTSIVIIPILVIILLLSEQSNLKLINRQLSHQHAEDIHHILGQKIGDALETSTIELNNLEDINWEELLGNDLVEDFLILDTSYKPIYSPLEDERLGEIMIKFHQEGKSEFQEGLISEIVQEDSLLGYLLVTHQENLIQTQRPYFYFLILIPLVIGSVLFFKLMHQGLHILTSYYHNIHQSYVQASYEKDIYLDKYLRSERLVNMGRFASGLAHEIGNPLSSIISSTEILKKYELNTIEREGYYNQILNDSYKIDSLIKEFLDFRKHKAEMKTKGNINVIILDAIGDLSSFLTNKDIKIHTDLAKDLPDLIVDESRIKMVFTNLIKNAYQSIEDEGFVQIRTLNIENGIRIRIRDSGKGISPEDMESIFSPFFTTKDVGEGFGLGLFITMQIIHAHNGKLKVESNLGKGSIFTVDLVFEREEDYEE